jgi:nucleoid DNA-binding protein
MATTSKKDLVNRIAESTGVRQVLVKTVVQQFFDEVIAELVRGNRLEFRDFGVFEPKTTPARKAQNPKTLEKIEVPAKRRVVFRPGRLMKKGLNASQQAAYSTSAETRRTSASKSDPSLEETSDEP